MKNKVSDVRDHLVAMLEALGEEGVAAEEMDRRIERAKATSNVAGQYVALVKVECDAVRLFDETGLLPGSVETPAAIERPQPRILSIDPSRRAA